MKRTLSLVLALVMVLGSFSTVFAADLSVEEKAGAFLKEAGVLVGDTTSGDLMLEKGLLRQDSVILLSRLMGEFEVAKEFPTSEESPSYKDIRDKFYSPFLAWAEANKTFVGKAPQQFGFGDFLTTQEYARVLLVVLGYGEVEFKDTLDKAEELGLLADIDVDAEFLRGNMAVMTFNALGAKVKDSEKTLAEKLEIEMPVVEPEVPATLEVVSVKADNLRQVTVTFNQKVDEETATDVRNYKVDGYAFDRNLIELSEDATTVVLTTSEATSDFAHQTELSLVVENVKSLAGAKIASTKVKFTPVDNFIPQVEEVIALGTKALKIVFSEPVKRATAATTASYKIDNKSVAGSVQYHYPNTVIISTTMTTGDHKLSVSKVEDYQGFKVVTNDLPFTVVEDTAAPEIISAKSVDLKKVVLEFNEPVRNIRRAYFTSTSNLATINRINDSKFELVFTNNMSMAETTIYALDVEDYSGNKADRQIVITPELDVTRPEVKSIDVELNGSNHQFTVYFSKSVDQASAETKAYYTLKNSKGVVVGKGFDSKGNPVQSPVYTDTTVEKKVVFSSVGKLAAGDYTLEIAGIKDTTFIGNTMLPYVHNFEIGDTTNPTITRAWVEQTTVSGSSPTQYDAVMYIQFSEAMATDGDGNVLVNTKWNYSLNTAASTVVWTPIPTKANMELVNEDTVMIVLPRSQTNYAVANLGLRATLVSDLAGNYLGGTALVGTTAVSVGQGTSQISSVKATARDTIEVVFVGKLTNIDANDFVVYKLADERNVTLDSYSYNSAGNTVAIFKLASANRLAAHIDSFKFKVDRATQAQVATMDGFGTRVDVSEDKSITDGIRPVAIDYVTDVKAFNVVRDTNYKIQVRFNEAINVTNNVLDVVSVKIDGYEARVTSITDSTDLLVIDLGTSLVRKSDGTTAISLTDTSIIEVTLKDANTDAKVVVDAATAPNAATPFTLSSVLSDITTVANLGANNALVVAKSTLAANVLTAQGLHDGASEVVAVGNYIAGSKAIFQSAITAQAAVGTNPASTLAEVNAAIADLATATTVFNNSKVVAAVVDNATITIDGAAGTTGTITVTIDGVAGETVAVADLDAAIATSTVAGGVVTFTSVAAGTDSTITLNVIKDGQVIRTIVVEVVVTIS